MRMWIGLFMVMTFPAIGSSDGYWNVIQRNVWDVAQYVQQNQENLWNRVTFVEVSGCPCGCGCKDCDPNVPCDCGCECGKLIYSYDKEDGFTYEFKGNKYTGNATDQYGRKWKNGVLQTEVMTSNCSS